MKTIWLVERGFDPKTNDFIEALSEMKDVELYEFKKRPFIPVNFTDDIPIENQPVMVYGSINFVMDFQRAKLCGFPGHYATFENYLTTRYYHHYHDHILNNEHFLVTAGSLVQRDFWTEDDYAFIRPDRADKPFVGQVVHFKHLQKTIKNYLGMESLNPHDLILVSTPWKIKSEARILVVGGKVITGSLYGKGRKHKSHSKLEMFLNFVRKLNLTFIPDSAFSVDVVELSTGEIKIAELSAFSCMGLYDMNKEKVAKAVNAQVQSEWSNYTSELSIDKSS